MSHKIAKAQRKAARSGNEGRGRRGGWRGWLRSGSRGRLGVWVLLGVPVAALALWALTAVGGPSGGSAYAVGSPGPGSAAPPISLASSDGGTFDLAALADDTRVLLYFQEGLTCQPCWDQMVAIEQRRDEFDALGIDRVVSVTTDPLGLVKQKVRDDGIRTPVLSDPGAQVSDAYDARAYSMEWMSPMRNGHSFIVVENERILWRADYGGAPDYTMFLEVDTLLADLTAGLEGTT